MALSAPPLPPEADTHIGLLYAHVATAQAGQVLDVLIESVALGIDLPDDLLQRADSLLDEIFHSSIRSEG